MSAKMGRLFFFIVLALALAACSSVGAKSDPNVPVTVQITANEFGFKSSMTTFTVGQKYHFEIINKGVIPHEIMLVKPIQPGMMDMEAMDKLALAHVTDEELTAGVTKTMDYTFTKEDAAEKLEFACHVPGHYEAGMKLAITVK